MFEPTKPTAHIQHVAAKRSIDNRARLDWLAVASPTSSPDRAIRYKLHLPPRRSIAHLRHFLPLPAARCQLDD
jgi:hypothetical protein